MTSVREMCSRPLAKNSWAASGSGCDAAEGYDLVANALETGRQELLGGVGIGLGGAERGDLLANALEPVREELLGGVGVWL